jgi:hypothetical protein
VGNSVFFHADDGVNGYELWAVHLGTFGGALAEPFASGCPGTANLVPAVSAQALPMLGNAGFGARVTSARANSPAVMLLGAKRGSVALGGGCFLWLSLPIPLALSTLTDAGGSASIGLPIPNGIELLGAELFLQWAVADPSGAFAGVASLSDGLHVVIGN